MGSPQLHRCNSDTTCDSDLLPLDSPRPRFSDANSFGESGLSQECDSSRSLFCLAVINPDTGLPDRIATPHEAMAVSRAMAAENAPCTSGSEDSEQPAADYAFVTSNPLCRIGGPCRHCGARGPSLCLVFRRTRALWHCCILTCAPRHCLQHRDLRNRRCRLCRFCRLHCL